MSLTPYRNILAIPGVRAVLLGGLLARVPYAAMGLSLTLFVRFGLDQGYFAAGVCGAMMVIGMSIGSTLLGRMADRVGLRPVLALTTAAMALFWLSASLLPYWALLIAVLPAGVLTLPVFVVVRQPLAVLVPPEQRRTAYSLDSMLVELSFMIAPASATVLATTVSSRITLIVIGVWATVAGTVLWLINPRVRAEHDIADAAVPAPPRRTWLRGPMVGMLIVGAGATVALGGSDVAVVSLLEHHDQLHWAWLVLAPWALYSLIGGFVMGATNRPVSPLVLLAVLGASTVPLGLLGQWWLLALAFIPAGFVTAPTIAASVDRVSRLAPSSVRGEAMGMHGSAITIGTAIGAPLVGLAVDQLGVQWGFAVAGGGALVAAGVAALLARGEPADTPDDVSAAEAEPVTA